MDTDLESAKFLDQKGINYKLIKLKDRAISVEDVIRYADGNINPDEICKTIILKDKKDNRYAMFLLGKQKIDFSKVKEIISGKVSIVSYDEVKKATGMEPGAVCPVLLRIPIFVDKRVFDKEKINFGSGNHLYGLEVAAKDLEKAINFKVVDIAEI